MGGGLWAEDTRVCGVAYGCGSYGTPWKMGALRREVKLVKQEVLGQKKAWYCKSAMEETGAGQVGPMGWERP